MESIYGLNRLISMPKMERELLGQDYGEECGDELQESHTEMNTTHSQ
jgi:hypothetical protein